MTSAHRLDWDDLDLVNADNGSGSLPYWFETLADGFSLGSPQARKVIVANLMRDGSDSRIDGHDNRTITFRVTVCGPDLAALAAGERALVLQSAALRSNLSWTPADGFGATTVFTVLNATLDPVADDLAEVRSGTKRRAYDITFECQPFGRSAVLSTTTFTTGAATTTTVDAASALTNWSLTAGTASLSTVTWLADSALKVDAVAMGYGAPDYLQIHWSGAVPVANYWAMDIAPADGSYLGYSGGTMVPPTSSGVLLNRALPDASEIQSSGYTRVFWRNLGVSPTFTVYGSAYNATGLDFYIGGLYSSATVPNSGVLVAAVAGSVRTQGSLTVTRASGGLSNLMVYADPTLISHGWQPGRSASWAQAPANQGPYEVYIDSAAISGYATGSLFEAIVTNAAGESQTIRQRVGQTARWQLLGMVELGGRRDGRVGALTVSVTHAPPAGSSSAVTTPVLRIFRRADDTSLIHLRAGTNQPVIIDTPSTEFPRGGVWADGFDALPVALSWETVQIAPPVAALYLVDDTSSSSYLTVTLEHYPRSHTYSSV